ncbi:hypothetical protein F8M49_13570 [Rhodococcus zopfii]|uniref:Uncharacterized protein n=1 Tax=Rhodococcus zopfii TaxID=43772 RepID=A0ABU3WQ38_9NOCA|nr:hypothetical protein [Rhodococcus zopfii]
MLRPQYRLVRTPLAVFEQHLPILLDQAAPFHSACRRILITCDRIAAHALRDGSAARAADYLEHHQTTHRDALAQQQRDQDRQRAAVLDDHRRRFLDRQHRSGATSPPMKGTGP